MKKNIFYVFMGIWLFGAITLNADFLMPNQAFKPYAKVNDRQQIITGVKIAKSIYLYEKELKIELLEPKGLYIKSIEAPTAVEHEGEKVFLQTPEFVLTLGKDDSLSGIVDAKVKIVYQGCSEEGLCYEPSEKVLSVKIDVSKLGNAKESKEQTTAQKSETDMIADTIKSSSFFVVLATFFVFGVLLSLTPCVFPMIPIISGLIVSQGEGLTTKKAFFLSLVYVLAMALAYTIAGVLAGLFGANLQAALQNPWVVYSFAAVFVALALSMFGYYELKLPDALVSKVSQNSNRSGFVGVAIMGFLSALIVGPCVAAPLAGALVYIGQTGDALLGGAALFTMSLGMGLPLIVVGVSAGKFMPKPGAWMTLVNAIFGVLMLGVAIWMLEKVVSYEVIVLLYSFLGIGFGLYLGALTQEGHIFKRTVAFLLFIYSVALFVGVLAGNASMTKPLGFLTAKEKSHVSAQNANALEFQVVKNKEELQKLLDANRGKKVLLDFSAAWCTACKELEEVTFKDPAVQKKMREFVLIRADLTENSKEQKELAKAYGVFGPPVILLFDKSGKLLESKRIVGFVEPELFLQRVDF